MSTASTLEFSAGGRKRKKKAHPIPSPKQQAIAAVLKEKVCVSRSYTATLRKFVSAAIKAGPSAFLFYSIHKMHITEQLCQRQGIFLDNTTWKKRLPVGAIHVTCCRKLCGFRCKSLLLVLAVKLRWEPSHLVLHLGQGSLGLIQSPWKLVHSW